MLELKEIYYFGSFNPFHMGHKMVASVVSSHFCGCKVHITPTPCSPLKNSKDMLPIDVRLAVIESSLTPVLTDIITRNLDISCIDIEVGKDKEEHYTYETLQVIKNQCVGDSKEIGILLGSDELAIFDKWKKWEWIYDNFTIVVYPRRGDDIDALLKKFPKVVLGTPYYNQGEMEFPPQFGNSKMSETSDELFEKLKKEGIYEMATENTCVSPLPYIYFDYSSTDIRNMFKNFEENKENLRGMYYDKTIKILEDYYGRNCE